MTLQDMHRRTSLPGSGFGRTRSDSPDGRTTARSGQAHAPASPSALPASAAVQMTLDIFGPNGAASYESAGLQSSLVSRLQARMASHGSTWFTLTWKVRVTPSRRSIYALRASGRRTSGSGCTSRPTPTTSEDKHSDNYNKNLTLKGAALL